MPAPRPKAHLGFTLVELLVVVAIIVVLLALLVPSLDKAMGSARSAICLANAHVWTVAMRQYSLDWKGAVVYIPVNDGRKNYWYDKLAPYVGETDWDPDPANRPADVMKVNYCPETARHVNYGGQFGSARLTWNSSTAQGSYGWNLWIASDYFTVDGTNRDSRFPPSDFFNRYSRAPGGVPILGDSNWIGSWPDDVDTVPTDLEYGHSAHEVGFFMGRFSVARHGRTINVAFVDGSSRNTPLWDLWALPWNRTFKSGSQDPALFKPVN
jgi:prepilin-type N-terminal cleavage/methylation domain-containing protein/prepilin-type processing-associated H-X9-DG protein